MFVIRLIFLFFCSFVVAVDPVSIISIHALPETNNTMTVEQLMCTGGSQNKKGLQLILGSTLSTFMVAQEKFVVEQEKMREDAENKDQAKNLLGSLPNDGNVGDNNAETDLSLAIDNCIQVGQQDTFSLTVVSGVVENATLDLLDSSSPAGNQADEDSERDLDLAIRNGNTEFINAFSQNQLVGVGDETLELAQAVFSTAIRDGKTSLALALMGLPIDMNHPDVLGYPPLHSATKNCNQVLIDALLQRADVQVSQLDTYCGSTPLHRAIREDQTWLALKLLAHSSMDVNVVDWYGQTVLELAIIKGNIDVINALLARPGVNAGRLDKNGDALVHRAISAGDLQLLLRLLDHSSINVNARNKLGYSPLELAISKGDTKVIDALLERADVKVSELDSYGSTPLHRAIQEDTIWLALKLLAHSSMDVNVVDKYGQTVLELAIIKGNIDVIKALLEKLAISVDDRVLQCAQNIFFTAIYNDETSLAIALMDLPIDVNAPSITWERSPLHLAIECKRTELVEALLSHKSINPNVKDISSRLHNSPLHLAVRNNYLEGVRFLLKTAKIAVNQKDGNGDTALSIALREKKLEIAQAFLSRLLDVDMRTLNSCHRTILQEAVVWCPDFVPVLLQQKDLDVCINTVTHDGDTALHLALKEDKEAVAKALLAISGININIANKSGRTPLHQAVIYSKNSVPLLLQQKDLDVNVVDDSGDTALHLATKRNLHEIVIKLLQSQNIDVTVKNKDGKTPLKIAEEQGFETIIDAIEAKINK